MSERDELARLRRLRELEAKAAGQSSAQAPRIQPRQNITVSNPFVQFAEGAKGGFDRAAYGLAEAVDAVTPDLPISPETRAAYNQNPVVRTLGLTMPSPDERQAAIDQSRRNAEGSTAGFIGDMVGNAAPAIAAGIATAGGSVLPAMATQAGVGFLTTPGGFEDRAAVGAMSAGGEAAGRALPRAFARLAQPVRPTDAAKRMANSGIYPTPGQAAGGIFKSLEDYSTSVPGWGHAVRNAQDKLQKEAAGLAMSQGSISVPGGREGYKELSKYFDDGFTNAVRPLAFDAADPAFDAGVKNIMQQRGLDAAGINDINRFLGSVRTKAGAPANGLVLGDDFHAMLQNLRTEGSAFRKAQDPFQNRLGEAYRDIYNLADNSLATQGFVGADDLAAFRNIRQDYARVAPALKAGELTTVVRNQGVFTPEQYQSEVAKNAKKMGSTRALREGTLPQQLLADDMVDLFGGRPPDSGTATRTVLTGVIPGLAGLSSLGSGGLVGGLVDGGLALGAIGGSNLLGRGLYSDPVRRYMLGGYSGQRAIADALRNFSPYTGTAGAAVAPQMFNE
ncbi:hypothetical protein UFOVP381_1 [uncultured Caudovirales phage]|uniref:Uncharacterized protein n=1 Tax=uncultured Caudovirales phage TaxID=2100421 RepID=A0A6J7X4H6_9CAUD|nr:hypothetical protein UFOVP381_1 [uncultured Caudovirales phage]